MKSVAGDLSLRPRVVTELLGARVEALIERWSCKGFFGPLIDESCTKTGRVVTVGIGEDNAIIVQIEDDEGWVHTASRFRRLAP